MAHSKLTVSELADRVVELGLADPMTEHSGVSPEELHGALEDFGADESQAVLILLEYMNVRYSTEHGAFRHACQDNARGYRRELDQVAACGRGAFNLTEVALADTPSGDHLLRFRCNDELHEWLIPHGPDESGDAQMIFCESVGELVPAGSPARWCTVYPGDPDVAWEVFFGDPAALNDLGAPFGLEFEPVRTDPDPADAEHLQSWLRARRAGFGEWTAVYGDGVAWDFSAKSLTALGAIVLRRIATLDTLADPANTDFVEGASWYLGEALLRIEGGRWCYRAGDPDLNYWDGYPFIEQDGHYGYSAVPYRTLRILIKRGDPNHLRKRFDDFRA